MGQLEPDHCQPPGRVLPPGILMPEEEVSAGPKGDRGDGAPGSQFSLIIPVLTNVVLAVFVPAVREQAEFTEQSSLETRHPHPESSCASQETVPQTQAPAGAEGLHLAHTAKQAFHLVISPLNSPPTGHSLVVQWLGFHTCTARPRFGPWLGN